MQEKLENIFFKDNTVFFRFKQVPFKDRSKFFSTRKFDKLVAPIVLSWSLFWLDFFVYVMKNQVKIAQVKMQFWLHKATNFSKFSILCTIETGLNENNNFSWNCWWKNKIIPLTSLLSTNSVLKVLNFGKVYYLVPIRPYCVCQSNIS